MEENNRIKNFGLIGKGYFLFFDLICAFIIIVKKRNNNFENFEIDEIFQISFQFRDIN